MSLASSPDCLFRPEDKALKMLFPSTEDPSSNSFDDFFNGELYTLSDNDDNREPFGNLDDFFTSDLYNSGALRLPSLGGPAAREITPPQPWRKGLWCLNQGQDSEIVVEKTRKNERKPRNVVNTRLANNDNFTIRSPRSPPDTPSLNIAKRSATSPRAAKYNQSPYYHPGVTREVTLSPSPMYTNLPGNGRMGQQDTWQQDFQNFHLQMSNDRSPMSPPVSGRMIQHDYTTRRINAAVVAHNATIPQYHGHISPMYREQNPIPSIEGAYHPEIDPGLLDPTFGTQGLDMGSCATGQIQQPLHQYSDELPPSIPTWTTESLHSSDGSHISASNPSSHTSYETSHGLTNPYSHGWFSPPQGAHPQLPMAPQEYYPVLAAPKPQRAPHQILQQPVDTLYQGLGIHYPELDQKSQAILHEPHDQQHHFDVPPGTAIPYPPSMPQIPHVMISYPPLPPPGTHCFPDTSPFTTPKRRGKSPSRSPSPPISPTNTTRTLRQRSPTRTDCNQLRRKSIHKTGPIRDSHEPMPAARDRSTSKPPRTPKTPKTPTGGFSQIDFVNFTPKDSRKLLNDVAPSGSSKTKARREAEAREKRKKLGEAALKAVMRAGGDVSALERAILA